MLLDAALPPVPLSDVPEIAIEAERIGFDTLWSTETMHDPFLPFVQAAKIRDSGCCFLRTQSYNAGIHCLGPGSNFPGTVLPGIRHSSKVTYRT